MATRLYLTTTAIPYNPSTLRGSWDATASPSTGKLEAVPAGANTTITKTETSSTNNYDILFGKWVSDALLEAVTIAGTLNLCLRVSEGNADANAFYHLHIFVTQGDTDNVRGTLLSDYIGSGEFPTTAQGLAITGISLSSVNAQAGDRIVIEVGAQLQNTHTTSRNIVIAYGGTNTVDLTNANTTTGRPKWIEFSTELPIVPKFETLIDNFNDNSLDSGLWTNWGGANVTEQNQRLETVGSTVASDYFGIDSAGFYTLVGSYAFCQLVDKGADHASRVVQPVGLNRNADNTVYWEYNNGFLRCWKQVATTYTQVGTDLAYNSTNHKYLRLREASGTVYWDYSADGVNWSNHASETVANLFNMTGLSVTTGLVGNEATVTSASYAHFDNFNVIPSVSTSSTRAAKITGKDTSTSNRLAKLAGKETSTASRAAKLLAGGATAILTDDFADGILDSSKWPALQQGGNITGSETNGTIEFVLPASAASGDYGALRSHHAYNLVGSHVFAHIDSVPNPATNADMSLLVDTGITDNWLRWVYEAGTIYAQYNEGAGIQTLGTVPFSDATRFWRLREASGTVYFDTSPDGVNWTPRFNYSTALTLTRVTLVIEVYVWQNETNPGGGSIASINVTPSTATASRNAKLAGIDTASSTRASKISGKASDTSNRAARLTGNDSSSSSRPSKLTGVDTATSNRAAKITGVETAAGSSRAAKLLGKVLDISSRLAKLIGKQTDSTSRAAKITGTLTDTSNRGGHLTGKDTATSNRAAKVTGIVATTVTRLARTSGKDISSSARGAKATGQDNTTSTRSGKLVGVNSTTENRNAKTTGKAAAQSIRQARITGKVTVVEGRAIKLTGVDMAVSYVMAHLYGQELDADYRLLRLTGYALASSSRMAKLTGRVIRSRPTILPSGTDVTILHSRGKSTPLNIVPPTTL